MTSKERTSKYLAFINKIHYAAKEGNLTDVILQCQEDHVDPHIFAELVKRGYFYMHARGRKGRWYKSDRVEPFTYEEIDQVLTDLATRIKIKSVNSTPRAQKEEVKDGVVFRSLSEYTPRELIDELKRRGYTGKLLFTKEIRF